MRSRECGAGSRAFSGPIRSRVTASVVVCALPLFVAGTGHAETCPCWTPEELAAIRTDACENCENFINLGGPLNGHKTCIDINIFPEQEGVEPCTLHDPNSGVVAVWDQAYLLEFPPPGCYIWDYGQGIDGVRIMGGLTPGQAAACVEDIVARGTATAALHPGIPYGCMGQCFPPDCTMSVLKSRCSNTLIPCEFQADCESFGFCSIEGVPCLTNSDCSPVGLCAANSALCHAAGDCPKECSQTGLPCVDETECPGGINVCTQTPCNGISVQSCEGNPTIGTCDDWVAFTSQKFDLVSGLASELIADRGFTRAQCEGVQTTTLEWPGYFAVIADPTLDPLPGDASYYLSRAVEGASCRDHGDSSMEPEPRDLLDAACP